MIIQIRGNILYQYHDIIIFSKQNLFMNISAVILTTKFIIDTFKICSRHRERERGGREGGLLFRILII